jgi:hypothetical protein
MAYRAGDEFNNDNLCGLFSSGHIPGGLAHKVDSDLEFDDEDDSSLNIPIQVTHTHCLRESLGTNTTTKVASIFHHMTTLGLNLSLFLNLLSWSDQYYITHPKIYYKWSMLIVSKELPSILSQWHT